MARYDLDISTADGVRQVHALVLSKYGRVIERNGWEPEDVVQSVLLRLCRATYDPSKACVSTWVIRIAGQELSERIREEQHTVPIGLTWDGDGEPCDPADVAVDTTTPEFTAAQVATYIAAAQRQFHTTSSALVETVIRGRITGLSLADIAVATGKTRERIRQIVERLPKHVPIGTNSPFAAESDSTPEPESGPNPTQTELPESDPNPTSTELPEPGATTTTPKPRPRRKGWHAANDYWRSLRRTTPADEPCRPGWLTAHQVALIRESYVPGEFGQHAIARVLGVPRYTVARVLRGECYTDREGTR